MESPELFLLFCKKLDKLKIKHLVTGSVATILYGEPRLTNDIDIILFVSNFDSSSFSNEFPLEDYYCPPEEVLVIESKRRQRGHFNLIHHDTGFRADIYFAPDDSFFDWALRHARNIELPGGSIAVAPPEYVLVSKLTYFREGGSEKHLSDIKGMLKEQIELDWRVIEAEVDRRGLRAELDLLKFGKRQ